MKKSNDKNTFSIGEAAAVLGVHPETLRNWHRQGLLQPCLTLGGHRRYAKADIDKLLNIKITKSLDIKFKTNISVSKSLLFDKEN